MRSAGFPHPRLIAQVSLLCAGAILLPPVMRGQTPGSITGVVTDPAATPVFGAIVQVAGSPLRAHTNDRGEFRLAGIAPGTVTLQFRRLGFVAVTRAMQIGVGEWPAPLNIVLPLLPTTIKPVVVQASRVEFTGRLAGYYKRLHRRSSGSFIPREQIDLRTGKSLSQLLGATPGINSLRLRSGGGSVRMRGRSCRPLVWLDGVPMPAGEVDLDAFPVSTLHGIELYLGSTTAPFDYTTSQGMSSCGTILLWSRGRDTEPPARAPTRLFDVEEMAATLSVFTADQVDTHAELRSPLPLQVAYPASLLAARIDGTAVAEFVVGVTGRIEAGTFAIVSATHPLFGEAVSHALEKATYSPALKKGVAVQQVVQQRFEFSSSDKPAEVSSVTGR